eukprot:170895-Chlamydomonas_euryale.AAC.1
MFWEAARPASVKRQADEKWLLERQALDQMTPSKGRPLTSDSFRRQALDKCLRQRQALNK